MDPLDRPDFASPARYPWANFLGIGAGKQKLAAQNEYEQDLINRYPFTEDCTQMTAMFNQMHAESNATLEQRNSSRKGKARNDLTGKLRAFDEYIPQAEAFIKTVSCAPKTEPVKTPQGGVDTSVLGSAVIPGSGSANAGATASAALGLPVTGSSNALKYALIGLGALVVIGGVVYLVKHKS